MWPRNIFEQVKYYSNSAITPISQAIAVIHQSESINHFTKGFNQIFRVPSFLKNSLQTNNIVVWQSLKSNILQSILPIILYRRGVNLVLDETPEWMSPIIHTIDWTLMVLYFSRFYLRQTIDNTIFQISLERTVSNDIEEYLPKLMAKLLAKSLCDMIIQIFSNGAEKDEAIYNALNIRFYSVFKGFFKLHPINDASFNKLQKPLEEIICDTLIQHDCVNMTNEHLIDSFPKIVSRIIVDTFSSPFKSSSSEVFEQNKYLLKKTLEQTFTKDRAESLCLQLFNQMPLTLNQCRPYLPIKYIESCSCINPKKIIHGAVSSSFYATGNLFFCLTPEILNMFVVVRPGARMLGQVFFTYIRLLIYGQSLNEYKVSGCTRHKYKIFSRNKSNSLGIAISIFLLSALGKECIEFFANQAYQDHYFKPNSIENFLITDAISNIVLLFGIISSLAFKEPLLGKKESTYDIFSFFREKIRLFIDVIKGADSGIESYKNIKRILNSPYFNTLGDWLMQGYAPYPKEFIQLLNLQFKQGSQKIPLDQIKHFKSDVITALFNKNSVKECLRLYEKEITATLSTVENWYDISKWLKGPVLALLSLPLPSIIRSMLTLHLLCLKDNSLPDAIQKIREMLLKISQEKNVIMIEVSPPTSPKEDKLEPRPSSQSLQSDSKEGKIVMVLEEDSDIEKDGEYCLVQEPSSPGDQETSTISFGESVRCTIWQKAGQRRRSIQSDRSDIPLKLIH